MKGYSSLFLLIALLLGGVAVAEDCIHSMTPLRNILLQYSESTGTQVTIDQRVYARVNIVARDELIVTSAVLYRMLVVHGHMAFEKDGVIHVVPVAIGREMSDELGKRWKG